MANSINNNPFYKYIFQAIEQKKDNNDNLFFISDWDIDNNAGIYLNDIILDTFLCGSQNASKYFLIDDEFTDIKSEIIKNNNLSIANKNISICPSGTSAVFAALSLLSKEFKNFLLFTPSYFLYQDILLYFGRSLVFFEFIPPNIDFCSMEKIIIENKIHVIVMTDPIFSLGQKIDINLYTIMQKICKKHGIWLLVDGVLSSCDWDSTPLSITPNSKIEYLNGYNNYIFIDSLPKRIGLNGNKFALLFSHVEFVKSVNEFLLYSCGSFTSSQFFMLKELYKEDSKCYIIDCIKRLLKFAQENYNLISSLLLGSSIALFPANSGYFASIKIPFSILSTTNELDSFQKFLDEFNTITLPLSIFQYNIQDCYAFRINLLKDKQKLLDFVIKLLQQI